MADKNQGIVIRTQADVEALSDSDLATVAAAAAREAKRRKEVAAGLVPVLTYDVACDEYGHGLPHVYGLDEVIEQARKMIAHRVANASEWERDPDRDLNAGHLTIRWRWRRERPAGQGEG